MNFLFLYCLEFTLIFSVHSVAKLCSEKLLDDKNKVPDSAFIESSFKDEFRGKWARESTNNELAWCPKNKISDHKREYLIIDLGEIYILKMIMTKGLSRHGFITASSYIIEYRRELSSAWKAYREKDVEKKIKGNKDHLTEKYESLDPSIIARWIKIYPLGESPVRICLVLQIYGCAYSSNVMEYRMEDGSQQHNLSDSNYDGDTTDRYLANGLGKLVSFIDSKTVNQKSFENPFLTGNEHLVGWYRPHKTGNVRVLIVFRFDVVRNFSSVRIETSNYYMANIKTFAKIRILFSLDGRFYDQNQIINIVIDDDQTNPNLRFITTDLRQRVGRFVKIALSFRTDWIVIRRIDFSSVPSETYPLSKPLTTQRIVAVTQLPKIQFPENDFFSIPLAYTLAIVISILIILLLIGIPCVTVFIRRQKHRNKKCKEALQRHYQEEQARFMTVSRQNFKDYVINPGVFTVSNFNHTLPTLNSRALQEASIYTSLAGSDTDSNCPSDKQQYMPPNFSLGNNNRDLTNDYSATSFMTLGSNGASYMPYYSNNAQLARSQMNLMSQYDIMTPISACQDMYPNDVQHNISMTMYGPIQLSIQGPVGNSMILSSVTPPDILLVSSLNQLKMAPTYTRIKLDNLKYLKTIGRGNFGSIHLAEWIFQRDTPPSNGKKFVCNEYNSLRESLTSSIETETSPNQVQAKQLASVKVLSKDAPTKIKREFYQEIKHLLSVSHTNFVSILNLEETSLGGCVVVSEYSPLQDIFSFLQPYSLSDLQNHTPNPHTNKVISQIQLLIVASQVASAMKHMEALQLVHCDLAARNILVMNEDLLVKISDIAMSQQKFKSDYVAVDGPPSNHVYKSTSCLLQNPPYSINYCPNINESPSVLPIRWMPWQALIKGIFSNKSDVYSFGVTLWELLTLCQKQPYHELTNEQVIINSNLQAHGDSRARTLTLPKIFSKELSDFITNCTLADDNKRPNFIEIDMFLQQKTMGCQPH